MTDEFVDDRLLPGSNNPPPDLKIGQDLLDELALNNTDLAMRQMELLGGFERAPAVIEDDKSSGKMAAFLTQLNGFVKAADAQRQKVKEPYLSGGRAVDGFFAQLIQPITKAFAALNTRQTAFLTAKANKARREAEERAAAARAEEDRKRREAEKAEREQRAAQAAARKATDDTARAEAAERQRVADAKADQARREQADAQARADAESKTANKSDAELSQTRGEMAMSSLRTRWTFEVEDISKVPAEYLEVNTRVVNAAIAGKNGKRDIPGLKIFPDKSAQNR